MKALLHKIKKNGHEIKDLPILNIAVNPKNH